MKDWVWFALFMVSIVCFAVNDNIEMAKHERHIEWLEHRVQMLEALNNISSYDPEFGGPGQAPGPSETLRSWARDLEEVKKP